jgi:hypothetical protein
MFTLFGLKGLHFKAMGEALRPERLKLLNCLKSRYNQKRFMFEYDNVE